MNLTPCAHCNDDHCDYQRDGEPCWGAIHVADRWEDGEGDVTWQHACQGHAEVCFGGAYVAP